MASCSGVPFEGKMCVVFAGGLDDATIVEQAHSSFSKALVSGTGAVALWRDCEIEHLPDGDCVAITLGKTEMPIFVEKLMAMGYTPLDTPVAV